MLRTSSNLRKAFTERPQRTIRVMSTCHLSEKKWYPEEDSVKELADSMGTVIGRVHLIDGCVSSKDDVIYTGEDVITMTPELFIRKHNRHPHVVCKMCVKLYHKRHGSRGQ